MKKRMRDITILIVGMMLVGVPVVAGCYISSKNVLYKTDYNANVTNVEEAIDILTNQVKEINNTGNSTSSDILSGKTAYVNGNKVVGTIESKGAETYTPSTSDQKIDAGKYLSGEQTILGDTNLVAANIAKGKTIFGVTGSYTSDGTATAADILNGKTAYVKGSKITGTRTAQNNSYGVKANNFHQLGSGQTCTFSCNFTPTVPGKLIVFMSATRNVSGVNSAWGTKKVTVGGTNINATSGGVDEWQGRYYWVTNVAANQAVSASTSISGSGTGLTSCSLFVVYVQ